MIGRLSLRRATIWPLGALVALTAVLAVSACGGTTGNSGQHNPAASASTNSGLPGAVVPADSGAPGSPSAPDSGSPSAPDSGSPSAPASGTAPSPVPASQYLDGMTPVSGSGNTGNAQVNGQYFADSVSLYVNSQPEDVSFNLERQWRSLQATVGLSDDSPEAEKVRFQVIADQRIIYDHTFVLGQSQQINLDVTHVLRLELVATLASDYVGQTQAVWGNANLLS